ncbi:MAG TPA: hypothetical protein PKY30_18175, partial [Myxococcota bacterium]|nr:hypothetical protein [Myxococcota bacterium]
SFFRFLPPPGVAEVVLEDLETGLRFVVAAEPRRMGMGEAIALDIGREGPALLMMRQSVFVVALAGKEVEPPSDRAFFIGTRQFRLIRTSQIALKTVGQIQESHPYRLVASVGRATGPEATLTDRVRNLNHTIRSENRAVLLYLLARRMVEDQAAGKSMEEAGWCTDEEVAVGIWGRDGERMEAGNLHVLVHRLRKEIEDAGFDSAFLEKHRRALRIRIVDVVVR